LNNRANGVLPNRPGATNEVFAADDSVRERVDVGRGHAPDARESGTASVGHVGPTAPR
jgi:hypothetical protein